MQIPAPEIFKAYDIRGIVQTALTADTVRQIGMALGMPFEVLTMAYQSSYSAARGALLMAWKAFRSKRDLLAKLLCQPVLELWLTDEVAEGRISCPGFFADDVIRAAWCAAIWTGDGPGSIDPTKEVDAAQKRVDLGRALAANIENNDAYKSARPGQQTVPRDQLVAAVRAIVDASQGAVK